MKINTVGLIIGIDPNGIKIPNLHMPMDLIRRTLHPMFYSNC